MFDFPMPWAVEEMEAEEYLGAREVKVEFVKTTDIPPAPPAQEALDKALDILWDVKSMVAEEGHDPAAWLILQHAIDYLMSLQPDCELS